MCRTQIKTNTNSIPHPQKSGCITPSRLGLALRLICVSAAAVQIRSCPEERSVQMTGQVLVLGFGFFFFFQFFSASHLKTLKQLVALVVDDYNNYWKTIEVWSGREGGNWNIDRWLLCAKQDFLRSAALWRTPSHNAYDKLFN